MASARNETRREGLLFDVEHAGLWGPEWGPRPDDAAERATTLKAAVDRAPKLAPLVSHRYIPCDPCEAGNPVFSIHQSDVIVYGCDLADDFAYELGGDRRPAARAAAYPVLVGPRRPRRPGPLLPQPGRVTERGAGKLPLGIAAAPG